MTPLSFDPYQDKERIETYMEVVSYRMVRKIPLVNIKLWLELITRRPYKNLNMKIDIQ